jgi:hypothetical protein
MKTLLTTATLITGVAAAGAQADVIYANDSFEGESVGQFANTANSTSYINSGDNLGNVAIIANIAGGPAGQHLAITGNLNKRVDQTNAMTLVTDGVVSLEVSLSLQLNNIDSRNRGRLLYSALGDFTDGITIQEFDADAVADPGNYVYAEDIWYDASVTITAADVGGAFTDTAKLRWAQADGGAFNTTFYIDDVVITGVVPEPGSLALLGLGGLLIGARRRRG